jgi:hypothetical protein
MDFLKKLFPAPKIPQKRYLVIFGLALYYAAKMYVASTPDPADDDLPDRVRTIVFEMFSDNNAPVKIEPGDYEEQNYGEKS